MNKDLDRLCFCCGKILKHHSPDHPGDPLGASWHDATDWTSIGNWTSTKLDCAVGGDCKVAQIVICDDCFEKNKDRIFKIEYTKEEEAKHKEEQKRGLALFLKAVTNEQNTNK